MQLLVAVAGGVLVHWQVEMLVAVAGEGVSGFMEVFSTDLQQCLLQMDPTLKFSLGM